MIHTQLMNPLHTPRSPLVETVKWYTSHEPTSHSQVVPRLIFPRHWLNQDWWYAIRSTLNSLSTDKIHWPPKQHYRNTLSIKSSLLEIHNCSSNLPRSFWRALLTSEQSMCRHYLTGLHKYQINVKANTADNKFACYFYLWGWNLSAWFSIHITCEGSAGFQSNFK